MYDLKERALIGGHPALDFVNSLEYRGEARERNYVPNFTALACWSVRVGLLTKRQEFVLRVASAENASGAARVWRDLMVLREALSKTFLAMAQQYKPPMEALVVINAQAASVHKYRALRHSELGLIWAWAGEPTDLRRLQWELVRCATNLLVSGTNRIRKCAHEPCDWMFLDTSRNGQRRWCQMETCGNLSKVRRFRKKRL